MKAIQDCRNIFLSNLYLKQGIGLVYVMVNFICVGLQELRGTRNNFIMDYILLTLYSQQTYILIKKQNDTNCIYDYNTRQNICYIVV